MAARVQNLIFVQNNEDLFGYGYLDFQGEMDADGELMVLKMLRQSVTPPYLLVSVESNEEGDGVQSTHVWFHTSDDLHSFVLQEEVRDVSLSLSSDLFSEGGGSLPEKIQKYLAMYGSESDLANTSILPALSDDQQRIVSPNKDNLPQRILDSFLIHTVTYLASLSLLMKDDIQQRLPFAFSLPYHSLQDQLLNVNVFQYLNPIAMAGLAAEKGHTSSHILFDRIIRFCNEWGHIFNSEGPKLDMQQSLMDTCSGYCSIVVQQASDLQERLDQAQEDVEHTIDCKLETIETRMQDLMDEQKKILHTFKQRLIEEVQCTIDEYIASKLETLPKPSSSVFFKKPSFSEEDSSSSSSASPPKRLQRRRLVPKERARRTLRKRKEKEPFQRRERQYRKRKTEKNKRRDV
jgi:hypothetical protein